MLRELPKNEHYRVPLALALGSGGIDHLHGRHRKLAIQNLRVGEKVIKNKNKNKSSLPKTPNNNNNFDSRKHGEYYCTKLRVYCRIMNPSGGTDLLNLVHTVSRHENNSNYTYLLIHTPLKTTNS